MVDGEWVKTFDRCPACGSTSRFFGAITKELKEREFANEDWNCVLDSKKGVMVDQRKQNAIPIGSTLPGYSFQTDICEDCGAIYCVRLERMKAVKSPSPPPPLSLPNRAERRRMEQGRN